MKKLVERFEKENLKGKMGEKLFYSEYILSPERFPYTYDKDCLDVSEIWQFQNVDVDVLFRNKEKKEKNIKEIINENHWLEKLDNNENDNTFYEIKIDGVIHRSRNFLYEVIKKDKPGRVAKSKADILVYIPVTENPPYKFYNYYWVINMFKLRKYVRETLHQEFNEIKDLSKNLANKVLNKETNNNELQVIAEQIINFRHSIKPFNYYKPKGLEKMTEKEIEAANIDTRILNLWVNIDELVKLGIAEKFEIKTSNEEKQKIENECNQKINNGTL